MLNNTQSLILTIIILILVFWCGGCSLKCGNKHEGLDTLSPEWCHFLGFGPDYCKAACGDDQCP